MKRLLILLLSGFLFTSCEKESVETLQIKDGTYTGTFTKVNNDPLAFALNVTAPTSVTINGDNYTSTGNPNRIPAGGSGKFTVNSSTINFSDKNIWTADFDWNLILSGEYKTEIKGDSLFLSKKSGYNLYSYRLGRAK